MRYFSFCPICGHELNPPAKEDGKSCPNCGRTWYRNMSPTVGAAIVKDGKALATVRAFDPEKGKCDVPGGFLHAHEDPLDGLQREVREELGIEIEASMDDVVQMVPHAYGEDGEWVLSIGFRARWVSGEPTPNDDVADYRWMSPDEIEAADFAWEHDRLLLRRALDEPGT